MTEKTVNRCSYCNRTQDEAGIMVKGDGSDNRDAAAFICRDCIVNGLNVINAEIQRRTGPIVPMKVPSPKDVLKYLNTHIVGQEGAKRATAVAVVNHYKRLISQRTGHYNGEFGDVDIEKSNVLLIGPTGCGKTELARRLAEMIEVPFAIGDATSLTAAGYVGEDVETLLLKLIQAANGDIAKAQNGILFIDEIDKISASRGNVSITRDVSGEGVQQGLLKIIEGTVANVPPTGGRKHPEAQYIQFDTSNILFICSGTFTGLEDIIGRRMGKKQIGFLSQSGPQSDQEKSDLVSNVTPEDLYEFGMIPEFIGRLPVIAHIDQLTQEALQRILVEPKNAILRQYQKLFSMDGVKLNFTEDAIVEIAKQAIKLKTGARALRGVVEKFMLPLMFDLPEMGANEICIIDADVVRQKGKVKIKEAA